jgi:hypothetical protein
MFTHSKNERMNWDFLRIRTNQGRGKGRVFLHLEAVKGRSKGRLQFTSLHQFFKRYFGQKLSGKKRIGFPESYFPFWHSILHPSLKTSATSEVARFNFQSSCELDILKFLPTLLQQTPNPAQFKFEGAKI